LSLPTPKINKIDILIDFIDFSGEIIDFYRKTLQKSSK